MYAIIRAGGKQHRVEAGDTLRVEKLNKEPGSELNLEDVLAVGGDNKKYIGEPALDQATVTAVVTQQSKSPKVTVFKKRRRQGYRRLRGHRQPYTELFIKAITTPEGETVQAEKKTEAEQPASKKNTPSTKKAGTKKKKKKASKKKKAVKKAGAKKATKKKATKKKAAKKKTTKKKSSR